MIAPWFECKPSGLNPWYNSSCFATPPPKEGKLVFTHTCICSHPPSFCHTVGKWHSLCWKLEGRRAYSHSVVTTWKQGWPFEHSRANFSASMMEMGFTAKPSDHDIRSGYLGKDSALKSEKTTSGCSLQPLFFFSPTALNSHLSSALPTVALGYIQSMSP